MSSPRAVVAALAAMLAVAAPAAAQGYRLVDLGANVFPARINDSRAVVGNVNDPPASHSRRGATSTTTA